MNDIPPKNSKNILADCFLIGGLTIASIAIAFWITQEGEGRGPSNAPNHRSISKARPLAASSLSGELDFYLMDFLQKPFNSEICSLEKYFKDMPVGKGLSLQPFSPEEAHGFMYTHREAFHRCEIRFKSMHLVKQTNKEAQPPAKNKGVPNLHRQNDNKSSSLLASCFTVSGENHAKALLELTLQIRDTKKLLYNETYQKVSMLDKITLPFGNMYKNFTNTQDFNQEELLKVGTANLNFPVEFIEFNLRENKRDRISLSWHLTKNEKQKIERAFKSSRNQASLKNLSKLLNE